MAELKTQKTHASVSGFVEAIADPLRRQDCQKVIDLMRAVTKEEPRMWGSSIVGFGSFTYKYGGGRTVDWLATGVSPRKQSLTIYLMDGCEAHSDLMSGLGTYTTGRSCLYVKRLADIDLGVLKKLVAASVKGIKKRFPDQ